MVAFFSRVTRFFVEPSVSEGASAPIVDPETAAMRGIKQRLLDQVREAALERGTTPTLEEYRLVCEYFGTHGEGKTMADEGKWNPRIAADLSHLKLDGFSISEPKITKNYDGNDLDGDGHINVQAINSFYRDIDFTGASLNRCFVEPATSFNAQLGQAKTLDGITFSNMRTGDRFVFSGREHHNITMLNIQGGDIEIAGNTRIDGLDIRGLHANISLGERASVSNITVDHKTCILKFELAPGATLTHSDLRAATISPASTLKNTIWEDVKIHGNFVDVDLSGSTLTNVVFDGSTFLHTNFSGVSLNKVEFKNVNLAELDLSAAASFQDVTINGTTYPNKQAFDMSQKIAAAGVTSFLWKPEYAQPTAPGLALAPAGEALGMATSPAKTTITFSGATDFNNFNQTAAVLAQPRTIAEEDKATTMNMTRFS